jgi:hypothetical protein
MRWTVRPQRSDVRESRLSEIHQAPLGNVQHYRDRRHTARRPGQMVDSPGRAIPRANPSQDQESDETLPGTEIANRQSYYFESSARCKASVQFKQLVCTWPGSAATNPKSKAIPSPKTMAKPSPEPSFICGGPANRHAAILPRQTLLKCNVTDQGFGLEKKREREPIARVCWGSHMVGHQWTRPHCLAWAKSRNRPCQRRSLCGQTVGHTRSVLLTAGSLLIPGLRF